MNKEFVIYCDGGAKGNPGPAGIGIVICDTDGNVFEERGEYIGEKTNNEAEYIALIRALEVAKKLTDEKLTCFLDSQLVVKQVTDEWSIKEDRLRKLYMTVKQLEKAFKNVIYHAVPRDNNKLKKADKLVNLAINRKSKIERVTKKVVSEEDAEVERLRKAVRISPKDWKAHYELGRELFRLGRYEEAERSLKASLRLTNSPVYMPHFYLGRIYYQQGRCSIAMREFDSVLEINPDYETAKWWWERANYASKEYTMGADRPAEVEEIKSVSKYRAIANYVWLEWLEWNLRDFIIRKLIEGYGEEEDQWWRKGVPEKIRSDCSAGCEEGLDEEAKLPPLYFADFPDYGKILKGNGKIFQPYFGNLKAWENRLSNLKKIRNAIAHSRSALLPEKYVSELRECCEDLQKIIKKS